MPGKKGGLRAIGDPELSQDVVDVTLHRAPGYEETRGNLVIVEALALEGSKPRGVSTVARIGYARISAVG